jgi:hypothetical protein
MPDTPEPAQYLETSVRETASANALHFSVGETRHRMLTNDAHALSRVGPSSSTVFARKGKAVERSRPGAICRPWKRGSAAADQLLASFALVTSAPRDQNAARRAIPRP